MEVLDAPVEELIPGAEEEVGDRLPEPRATPAKPLPGAVKVVHAFWMAGMSCDGCSIAAVGATQPSVESLMLGTIPGVPTVVLHHPVLAVEAGEASVDGKLRGVLSATEILLFAHQRKLRRQALVHSVSNQLN